MTVASISGVSAFNGNDAIRLDLFHAEQLAAKGTTCLQECQANAACVVFAEAANAECGSSQLAPQVSDNGTGAQQ